MTFDAGTIERARFLVRVVQKEISHLQQTDERLFSEPFTAERVALLTEDITLAERTEAFASRFSRLQDSVGDKLLPLLFHLYGEHSTPFIDSLDRAERLGLIDSTDQWMEVRKLRNQMVHEYIEDPGLLSSALNAGHAAVPLVIDAAMRVSKEVVRRIGDELST